MEDNKGLLQIETPENVQFAYEVAGLGSRFLAALMDSFFIVLIQLLIYFILFLVLDGEQILENSWLIAFLLFVSFLFLWGYYILFELFWNGQTPGKLWIGLRVLRVDGMPISITESFIRNLVRIIDFLPGVYGLGVVTMFIEPQFRRLGDLAAGTLVVYDQQELALSSLVGEMKKSIDQFSMPLADEGAERGDLLPVHHLTLDDWGTLESFLHRRHELAGYARWSLGKQLYDYFWAKMGLDSSLPVESREAKLEELKQQRK